MKETALFSYSVSQSSLNVIAFLLLLTRFTIHVTSPPTATTPKFTVC